MKLMIHSVAVLSLSLGLIVLLSSGVDARRRSYARPRNVGRFTGATTTTGTRGSCEDAKSRLSLTAIAPLSHVGQTTLTNPTLAWFVPGEKSYQMELLLFKETEGKPRQPLWKTPQPLQSQPGIMQFTLPDEVKLLPGQTYIWQIILKCNPNRPSQNQIAEAPIQLVEATHRKPGIQVDNQNGDEFWYDLIHDAQPSSTPANVRELITDLIAVESGENAEDRVKVQQERLEEVLTALKPVADQNKR